MFSVPLTLFKLCDVVIIATTAFNTASAAVKQTQTHLKAMWAEPCDFCVWIVSTHWEYSKNSSKFLDQNAFEPHIPRETNKQQWCKVVKSASIDANTHHNNNATVGKW